MPRQTLLVLLVLALAACSREAPPVAGASAPAAPEAVVVESPAAAPAPAADPDPAVTHFKGFGPARFGALEERVRTAWGRPMTGRTPIDLQNCHYLVPEARGVAVPDISFMIVDGQFARYDVRGMQYASPGGVRVGMHADDVLAAFPGRVEEQMNNFVYGARYLIVAPEDGGETRLVFEADARGRIGTWRIGRPPAVFYVEGCA